MSINLYQREIYASQLQHGERRNHKYLYKEGDRYIYPEDLKKGAQRAGKAVKDKAAELYNDRHIYADAAKNMASDAGKAIKNKWDNGGKDTAKKLAKHLLPSTLARGYETISDNNQVAKEGVNDMKQDYKKYKAAQKKRADEHKAERERITKEVDARLSKATEDYKKKQIKKVVDELPEGYVRKNDGYVYDELGAIVSEKQLAKILEKKKGKKIAKK